MFPLRLAVDILRQFSLVWAAVGSFYVNMAAVALCEHIVGTRFYRHHHVSLLLMPLFPRQIFMQRVVHNKSRSRTSIGNKNINIYLSEKDVALH